VLNITVPIRYFHRPGCVDDASGLGKTSRFTNRRRPVAKPKGMHRQTYLRLHATAFPRERAFLADVQRRHAKLEQRLAVLSRKATH
jgi:hypothetical protein